MVDREVVIVDLPGGAAIGLNPVASFAWPLLLDQAEDDIAGAIAARFDVDIETARRDLQQFVSALCDRGWIETC